LASWRRASSTRQWSGSRNVTVSAGSLRGPRKHRRAADGLRPTHPDFCELYALWPGFQSPQHQWRCDQEPPRHGLIGSLARPKKPAPASGQGQAFSARSFLVHRESSRWTNSSHKLGVAFAPKAFPASSEAGKALKPGPGSRDFQVRDRSECDQKPVARRASSDARLADARESLIMTSRD